MGYVFYRHYLIAWIILSGPSFHVLAQEGSPNQLRVKLGQILAQQPLTQGQTLAQITKLTRWKYQWQQDRYPPDSTYINCLLQLGVDYISLNAIDYPKATQVVRQAVELSQVKRPDVAADQPAKALYRLGMLLIEQSLPAVDILKKAIRQGQGIRAADRWVSTAYLYLAYTCNSAGDFQQAINNAERAEQIARSAGDNVLVAKALQEKAKTLKMTQQYVPARKAAEQAAALVEQDTFRAVTARAYQLLGSIATEQHYLKDALSYCQRAFQTALPNDPSRPNYAIELGRLYYELHQYDQAIDCFQYGFEKNNNEYAKAFSLDQLGLTYWQKKNYERALMYYQQALVIMPIGFNSIAVTSLPDEKSIRQADQKQHLLTLIQDKADTWLDYAKATGNDRKRLKAALDTYKVADQMIDFMRWEHTGQQSKLFWRDKTRSMYERAIETCYLLEDAGQAFRFMEKSRAVMLADKLNELGAQQKLTAQQLAEERQLQQSLSDQQNKLAGIAPGASPAYNEARMALFAKQDSLTTFLKSLEASNPAYYRYKYDNETIPLADLQGYLTQQAGSLLTYFVGDSALYILGVTGHKIILKKQSIRAYKQALDRFSVLLSTPLAMTKQTDVRQFLRLSNELYRQLLAPFALPKGRVVVSPDGFFVPFDALSSSATQPNYAVNDYAFSYVYSVGLLRKKGKTLARTAGVQSVDFLGVAPVNFSASLNQVMLPGSDAALTPIAGRFGVTTLLTHEAATRQAFLTQAAKARVIHLFTHATADSTSQEPRLYFADSTLQLSDLSNEALPNAQLVVLAACKTGIGANQRGEGVFSLARGFSALGVPSVLTTLWSVQNEATYQLTDLFYHYLDQGLPKDLALQRAKQDWLKTAEGTNQLPANWAGLIVVGDTEPLPHINIILWVGLLFAFLLAAGLIFWIERRKRQSSKLVSTLTGVLAR